DGACGSPFRLCHDWSSMRHDVAERRKLRQRMLCQMPTLLVTHPAFLDHDTGPGHPERPDRMRAIDKVLAHDHFADLIRTDAPLRDAVEEQILRAHLPSYLELIRAKRPQPGEGRVYLDGDTP